MSTLLTYSHTQRSPLRWLLYIPGVLMVAVAWFIRDEPTNITYGLLAAGAVLLLLAPSFHHLTVHDEGDRLAIAFGPLPVFHTAIPYDDMERVEVGRTLLIDGWGIHYSLRGGWVWNIWGRDCVVVHRRGGRITRIGTDDAPNLALFLQGRIDIVPTSDL
jgi:hypothetical protein